jgi:hypothetical protein
MMPKEDLPMGMEYRMDGRTFETFAHNIKDHHGRERVISRIMLAEFKELGRRCTVQDKGVDNTGAPIKGNLKNNNLDYEYTFEDGKKELYEIKNSPPNTDTFYTFKESALRAAVQQEGKILVYAKDHYLILKTEACAFLLHNFEPRIYEKFARHHPAVRVYSKNYRAAKNMDDREIGPVFWEELITRGLVEKRQWTKKAQWLMNEMAERLFMEKRR